DTPPTRNALDFIDAPRRLTRFLDNRLFRWFMMPTRVGLKAVNVATRTLLRTISRVVGSEVVQDAVAFFQAFEGMEEGFRQRAEKVLHLLSDPATAFLLVTTPRADALEEGRFFAAKLEEAGIPVEALVVNRMHPRFARISAEALRERATARAGTEVAGLYENLADFTLLAEVEEAHQRGAVAAHGHIATTLAGPADASDQSTETGGVDEGDGRHVDEQLGTRGKLAEGLPELPDRIGVELADRTADGVAVGLLQ